ncbi:limbic system-associated membrane protein-like [Carassius auratus]|uniref:Limbic system-associated membrane protein-like n=1 Tax=Carassius auratus TaxID=7957 RepID=A0A6P6NS44_CARAU|nr:limbic system-associated membrane protein-like [Carassius auratus]
MCVIITQAVRLSVRCYVDDKVSKVAWLNRSNIIFAGEDKWSLDPRVELVTQGQLEYSLRIQKVDVFDEGPYTCSIQTKQQPKTSQVYLIIQVPPVIYKVSEDITINEGSNVTLTCLANGRPDPSITWRLLNPSGERQPINCWKISY